MMKQRTKGFSRILVLSLLVVGLAVGTAPAADVHLNMGSTSSSSGVYAWCVAAANVINKANVGVNVTVVESGAGMDNLRKLSAGIFRPERPRYL